MPIEPIQFSLTSYNKLSIIRKQIDDRTREFEEIEATIRETLMYVKEVEYLKSISAAFTNLDASEQIAQLATLESRRSMLFDLINTLNDILSKTEQDAKSGKGADASAPRSIEKNSMSSPAAAATKPADGKKPLSFDEFKKKFPTSGV